MKVVLGKKYKDSITGFTGIASARSEYLYGCVRVLIEATRLKKDGDFLPDAWFDEPRLIAVKGKAVKRKPGSVGGPGKVAPYRDPKKF